jgi:RNase P protein component
MRILVPKVVSALHRGIGAGARRFQRLNRFERFLRIMAKNLTSCRSLVIADSRLNKFHPRSGFPFVKKKIATAERIKATLTP